MPKYDEKTIDQILKYVSAMRKCCYLAEQHMKKLEIWDELVEQFQEGMLNGYSNVIDLLTEMKNTAKAKHEKA